MCLSVKLTGDLTVNCCKMSQFGMLFKFQVFNIYVKMSQKKNVKGHKICT